METYRLPKSLIGRETPRGQVPAKLHPIFRDRDELPAASSLTEEVRAALDRSQALVVICSPAAAASQWVNREIELFRELHPDRPILLALKQGDPASAFPPYLLEGAADKEPLAADFSDTGDGRRLGLLKLVAGLTGVPLGDLVQRDAQRKMRRVMVVTVVAAVIALIMAAMAMVAIQNRNEAERQQAEAEGLVRFLITDLRDKLDDAGRLDLLTVANERALDYYRAQDLDSLDPGSLALRAEVLHAIGEDLEKSGDLAGALDAFEEAAATTQALLASDPENPELLYADAQSHFWVGFIAWRELRYEKATAGFERYREQSDLLVALDPENLDWQMEAGFAASNLGVVFLRTKGRAAQALDLFQDALARFEPVAAARPDNVDSQLEVSDAHAWIADAHAELGDFEAARLSRNRQAEVLTRLNARDPGNAEFQRAWIGHGLASGSLELEAGNIALGTRLLKSNFELASRHTAIDPANMQLEKQRVMTLIRLSEFAPELAARLSGETICGSAHQALEPEFGLLCNDIGIDLLDSAAVRQMRCRLGSNSLSPRMGLDVNYLIEDQQLCGK